MGTFTSPAKSYLSPHSRIHTPIGTRATWDCDHVQGNSSFYMVGNCSWCSEHSIRPAIHNHEQLPSVPSIQNTRTVAPPASGLRSLPVASSQIPSKSTRMIKLLKSLSIHWKKMGWKEAKTNQTPYFPLQFGSGCLKHYSAGCKSIICI